MKNRNWKAAPVFCAAVMSMLAAVPAWAAEAKLPEGIQVEGESLAGLTRQEAEKRIEERLDGMAGQLVILDVQGEKAGTTARDLGFYWSNPEEIQAAIGEYEEANLVRRYMMAADLEAEPLELPLEVSVEEEAIRAFVEEHCQDVVSVGQNASIIRENGAFQITPEVTGIEVDLEATAARLNQALAEGLEQEVRAEAVVKESQPAITAADLETIQDVLGTFSTDFSSSGAARSTNLSVGAGKINGHVLMPGETLSGYECLQPFTAANGYKSAAAYENGQVVDSIGGGVCQIATTLYNAALLAEIEITQRQNHSMSVGYVKPSRDAAIAGTYKDIKVTNNYETPIYVEGYTQGRTLTFTIYGKETRPANREIEFISETLGVVNPGAPKEVMNASMAPGSRRQVQSAHRGIRSRLWKVVRVDGAEVERTILSTDTYNASPAIVQVGPPLPAALPAPLPAPLPETTAGGATEGTVPETTPAIPEGPGYEQPSQSPSSVIVPVETTPAPSSEPAATAPATVPETAPAAPPEVPGALPEQPAV